MKRIIVSFFVAAAALAALSSCVREQIERPISQGVTVQFTAGTPETRTTFTDPADNSYPVLWVDGDEVYVTVNASESDKVAITPSADHKTASFKVNFNAGGITQNSETPQFDFYMVSPASAVLRNRNEGNVREIGIKIPSEQTPTAKSVDDKAQLLYASATGFADVNASVHFAKIEHLTAYGCISLTQVSGQIRSVELTAEKNWVGEYTYQVYPSAQWTESAAGKTIKVNTSSASNIWFACAPVDLSGSKLTVKVTTDAGEQVRELTMPANRQLASGKIACFTVDMAGSEPQGVKIERVWGKYSTADASWNEYYGGTPNTDRNVAMDDEYIYIAETNDTKNLWAISITDPSIVKKLPVGTVKDEGTFRLSCPRVIKNSDAAINGGKDVLAVSNMIWGDPTMYFYSEGIEADPTVVAMTTWAERRLGDTFTVWGTLQDGMLFFKDFDNATAMMTFRLLGKVSGSNALQGRFVMADGTGTGAYYPYPEDIRSGIYSSRDARKIWWVTTQSDPITATGGNECTLVQEESGYYLNVPSVQYIEFAGKRYVAYTRQVSGTDGRIIIIEGAATDDWKTIINTRKVVYHAPIQNEKENDSEPGESPKASGHSGMDLAVRQIDGAVYIAAVKQNVGLSLFKMSVE